MVFKKLYPRYLCKYKAEIVYLVFNQYLDYVALTSTKLASENA